METIISRLKPELEEMNAIIRSTLSTTNDLMNSVVSNYLRTKGKQIRPIMVLLSAKMFGEVTREVLYAGAALEMLHNATLIHDDIVDETKLRRGQSTINALEGNHVAVLVGDYFVSNALAAGIRTGNIRVISALSELGKELSLGEVDQICNARRHDLNPESYFSMIRKKTASLFINCVKLGADTVDASSPAVEPLARFAEQLGLCFQIRDDVFDYFDSKQIGKPTGNDLREGKVTLPLLYALNNAPEEEAAPMKALLEKEHLSEDDIAMLIEFAKSHGGIDHAFETMREMQRKALREIAIYPDSPWKQCFTDIFEFIISRDN